MKKRYQNISVMATLIILVVTYDIIIYTQRSMPDVASMSQTAIAGEDLWQKNNCASCHQIYGLGGYLGPDLTNVTSVSYKSEAYISSFLDGGVGAMPAFNFSETEKHQIFEFLDHVNKTGYYPNETKFNKIGWGKLKYK